MLHTVIFAFHNSVMSDVGALSTEANSNIQHCGEVTTKMIINENYPKNIPTSDTIYYFY